MRIVSTKHSPQLQYLLLQTISLDIFKWCHEHRDHVLQDTTPQMLSLVWHGAVLDGSREHEHVPGLRLHLYGVSEELLPVVRVPGVYVGPGQDGGGAVLLGEVSDQGHDLETHHVSRR